MDERLERGGRTVGVTIHFEGGLRDEGAFRRAIELARQFGIGRGWPSQPIDESRVELQRVRDEQPWDYVGPTRGIVLQPHENSEPLRLEFDSDLYLQEYCKTQFAPCDVHIEIIELLRQLEPEFALFLLDDEGEYWPSGDRAVLERHRDACFRALDEHLASDSNLAGPVRLPSGRILDLVSRE